MYKQKSFCLSEFLHSSVGLNISAVLNSPPRPFLMAPFLPFNMLAARPDASWNRNLIKKLNENLFHSDGCFRVERGTTEWWKNSNSHRRSAISYYQLRWNYYSKARPTTTRLGSFIEPCLLHSSWFAPKSITISGWVHSHEVCRIGLHILKCKYVIITIWSHILRTIPLE